MTNFSFKIFPSPVTWEFPLPFLFGSSDIKMSQDDVQVKNFLIEIMRSRPMFWDKWREDFKDYKTLAVSKQEWLIILDEGRDKVKFSQLDLFVLFLNVNYIYILIPLGLPCLIPNCRFERHSKPTPQS